MPFRRTELITAEYLLGKQVGEGAHSKVLLGQSNRTGEIRAIKILEKRLCTPEHIQRYLKEIYMLHSLNHPYILKVYEYFEDEERIYAVT